MPSVISATTTNGVAISPDNSGSLQLQTNNGTTAVTIDTSQNVGIGTTSANKLGITKAVTTNSSSGYAGYELSVGDAITADFITNSSNAFVSTRTAIPLVFQTNDTERMRITSGGDVGIGTSSPTQKLDVRSAVAISDGTVNFVAGAGAFVGGQFGLGTTSNNLLAFATNNAERMRITSGGDLLVGATATLNSNRLFVARSTFVAGFNVLDGTGEAVRFYSNGTGVGTISVTGSATAYNTSSDYRLKENIAPMQNALSVVAQLKPVTYNWKVDGSAGQGFIAHELQAVVPDCVTGEKDAVDEEGNPVYQGVDTSFLVATLTAAIQELKAQLDESNLILTSVKTELDTVKSELNTLKNPPVEGTE